ncbi:uncharacterized protein LOC141779538 [Sebastes fasciatus]|uniref:uncharacterized protein LOC141779538 n=1 Tax=Sebastes fasciatus TaxID=394691 RepID=UPI003D9F1A2A
MMSTDIMRVALLLSLCSCLASGLAITGGLLEVEAVFGDDSTLECTAEPKPGVQYIAVRWYKVGEPPLPRLSGLLTRDLPDGPTRWYTGLEREVELLRDSRNVLLPNVTCDDGGLYQCHLAAPVGEQNREGQVLLTLTDCPTDGPSEDPMTDTYVLIVAAIVLMLGLVIFFISYGSLKNILRDRNQITKKETLLDAPLRPLEKKDLQLIYTLGPKVSKTPTMKHVCV